MASIADIKPLPYDDNTAAEWYTWIQDKPPHILFEVLALYGIRQFALGIPQQQVINGLVWFRGPPPGDATTLPNIQRLKTLAFDESKQHMKHTCYTATLALTEFINQCNPRSHTLAQTNTDWITTINRFKTIRDDMKQVRMYICACIYL